MSFRHRKTPGASSSSEQPSDLDAGAQTNAYAPLDHGMGSYGTPNQALAPVSGGVYAGRTGYNVADAMYNDQKSSYAYSTAPPQPQGSRLRSSSPLKWTEQDALEEKKERRTSMVVGALLFVIAFIVRAWRIDHPDQAVFDEVHFGAFAGRYLQRAFYFDVHPPLSKMLNGLAGYLTGFDGQFGFESIGDSYAVHKVNYLGMRYFNAILGSLIVPVIYSIMRESGYPILIAVFSASLVLFDNAHVTQSRLILLDASFLLFVSLALLSYVKFYKQRYQPFSRDWWIWIHLTGLFLACTLSSKMGGQLIFLPVGSAVIWDLWNLLDIRRGHSMAYFTRHFLARAWALIAFPLCIYLMFYWIELKILIYSGPGDSFMSPAFQETLKGNELLLNSQEIRYYDTVTIRHRDTKAFLHSHPDKYPLRYDDGRISSQGQQVTGYPHEDINNHWQIVPTREIPNTGRGRVLRHRDVIQFIHVATNSTLMSHDVASPLTPTNTEFTTWPNDDKSRYNDTLFQVQVEDAFEGEPWKTKAGLFKLIHMETRVAMYTYTSTLPEWAYGQQEVNGNKNMMDKGNRWFVDAIISDGSGHDFRNRTVDIPEKEAKSRNFFKKFFEYQILQLQHNAGLTASHPYASSPFNWPFSLSGISFWTATDKQEQIYLIGNFVGFWICVVSLSVFAGVMGADALARRRGLDPIEEPIRNRMLRNTLFWVGVWAFFYFPFYLLNRQRFLHHYLPAHIATTLIAGSVLNFVLVERVNYPVSVPGQSTRLRPKMRAKLSKPGVVVVAALIASVIAMFWFLAPLTYGLELDSEAVSRRKLLSTMSLHWEAKIKPNN